MNNFLFTAAIALLSAALGHPFLEANAKDLSCRLTVDRSQRCNFNEAPKRLSLQAFEIVRRHSTSWHHKPARRHQFEQAENVIRDESRHPLQALGLSNISEGCGLSPCQNLPANATCRLMIINKQWLREQCLLYGGGS